MKDDSNAAATRILTFEEQLEDGEFNRHNLADAAGQLLEDSITLAKLVQVLGMKHMPIATGREEYVLDNSNQDVPRDKRPVLGTAPTYRCATLCETRYYFAGDGCETWLLLDGHFDLEVFLCNG